MHKKLIAVLSFLFVFSLMADNPKYIFLFIGDGMSSPQRSMTEAFLKKTKGETLLINHFPVNAATRTSSANALVTDSAASGTAIACGEKTNNGRIGMSADNTRKIYSSAYEAKQAGKKVGIITSVTINHATPASFYGHRASRNEYYEIGLDLVDSGYDYFAGGAVAQPNNEKSPAYKGDIYELAAKAGYKVVKTREDFRALSRENDANNKVIACGIEGPGYMPNYIDNHEGLLLTDFVKKGIELLDNPKGFFMMCEGGAIDVNCHANDAATVIFETLAFNDAVKVAYEFAQKHPQETLIVITGDHETGALTLGFANTGFRENIDKLALQKSSFGVIKDKLKALGKNKQDLVFDDVKPILTDSFSFKFDGPANDPMTITAAELDQLKAAFDLQYKSEKKNGNAVQVTALKIFNAKVGIAWHSGGHSALPVITSAWGNGSERFNMGEYENTFISHTMKELVK